APPELAEDWDNVGLLVGNPNEVVERAMVALDPTREVVEEAMQQVCYLLITHHPAIFQPLRRVRTDDPTGRVIVELLQQRMHHIAAHTNFDNAPSGMGDALAGALRLENVEVLAPRQREVLYKVVVFVPTEAVDAVRDAMAAVGAGVIGNYSHCSFRAPGTGTFRPLEGASPYLGEVGQLEQAEEFRLEMLVGERQLPATLEAMRRAHPYEEVAYDVYRLENKGKSLGAGRVGQLKQAVTLREFAQFVGRELGAAHVRAVGSLERRVQRVALCGGSGAFLIDAAHQAGADVLVTGDIKHHDALKAQARGLAVVDPTHAATEQIFVRVVAEHLRCTLGDRLQVFTSEASANPFRHIESQGVRVSTLTR
ncbi:MAG: Nif3-like dinuclear metal center hexameric protein, partial [Abditibacteriales bacterium]|nr:Nif3-like dinuclear metal center hexameric protein [Abditibacteriales bacterium]